MGAVSPIAHQPNVHSIRANLGGAPLPPIGELCRNVRARVEDFILKVGLRQNRISCSQKTGFKPTGYAAFLKAKSQPYRRFFR